VASGDDRAGGQKKRREERTGVERGAEGRNKRDRIKSRSGAGCVVPLVGSLDPTNVDRIVDVGDPLKKRGGARRTHRTGY